MGKSLGAEFTVLRNVAKFVGEVEFTIVVDILHCRPYISVCVMYYIVFIVIINDAIR